VAALSRKIRKGLAPWARGEPCAPKRVLRYRRAAEVSEFFEGTVAGNHSGGSPAFVAWSMKGGAGSLGSQRVQFADISSRRKKRRRAHFRNPAQSRVPATAGRGKIGGQDPNIPPFQRRGQPERSLLRALAGAITTIQKARKAPPFLGNGEILGKGGGGSGKEGVSATHRKGKGLAKKMKIEKK